MEQGCKEFNVKKKKKTPPKALVGTRHEAALCVGTLNTRKKVTFSDIFKL